MRGMCGVVSCGRERVRRAVRGITSVAACARRVIDVMDGVAGVAGMFEFMGEEWRWKKVEVSVGVSSGLGGRGNF